MTETIAGILLAGGQSRRFGANKAFATYNGTPLYRYSYDVLKNVSSQVIVIGDQEMTAKMALDPETLYKEDNETFKGLGPLAGIYSAMEGLSSEWYAVLPCDVPLIKKEIFEKLLTYVDRKTVNGSMPAGIIPVVNGKQQPLTGLYHHSTSVIIKGLLETNNLRMSDLLNSIETYYVEEQLFDERLFTNVNTRKALQDIE